MSLISTVGCSDTVTGTQVRYGDCVHGTEAGTYTFLTPKQSIYLAAAPNDNAEAAELRRGPSCTCT
jgi:hypothetical protein